MAKSPESHEVQLGKLLTRLDWKLAIVETTAGGLISSRVVEVPGCSSYFERGVVAYSRSSKTDLPGVTDELIETYGSVSREVAEALAEGVRRTSGADFGLAETGLAGPVQGRSPKPIGSVAIALSVSSESRSEECIVEGNRQQIRRLIVDRALDFALTYLEEADSKLSDDF